MTLLRRRKYHYVERNGQVGFKCMKCKLTSFHPKDIENRYCGNCHVFYEKQEPSRFECWWDEHGQHLIFVTVYTTFYGALIAFQSRMGNWQIGYALAVFNMFIFGMSRENDGRRIVHEQHLDLQRYMARQMKAIVDKAEDGG